MRSLEQARIARPRTFDLPPQSGPRLVIALRVWRRAMAGNSAWYTTDAGPYLITSALITPRDLGSVTLDR